MRVLYEVIFTVSEKALEASYHVTKSIARHKNRILYYCKNLLNQHAWKLFD